MQAYADAGIRATVAIDQPNVVEYEKYPFLAELLPEAERRAMDRAPRQSAAELLELYRHLIDRWHGAAGRPPRARRCPARRRSGSRPTTSPRSSALSERHDLPFNVHMLETKLQRVLGQEKYGKSLVRYVHDLGLLDERMMVIHAIWIDARRRRAARRERLHRRPQPGVQPPARAAASCRTTRCAPPASRSASAATR